MTLLCAKYRNTKQTLITRVSGIEITKHRNKADFPNTVGKTQQIRATQIVGGRVVYTKIPTLMQHTGLQRGPKIELLNFHKG